MYRIGSLVVHPDYGLGTFRGILGESVRIALVHFRGRGLRRIILPSARLRTCRIHREGRYPAPAAT